ncbi:MAG TPA: hypothetical protein VGF97_12510 [Rhizomicrobium sp.]|jgi:hypothetical protein
MRHSPLIVPSLFLLAAILAGCSSDKEDNCPTMTGVTDAAVQTVFREGAPQDPANVLYTVEITDVTGKCDIDKKDRTTNASVEVKFRATRAPSAAAAQYTVPYFVAVTRGTGPMMVKHVYSIPFSFEAGQTSTTFSDEIGSAVLHPDHEKQPYDYQILVGLQLTKAQLEYNRLGHYGQ